MRKKKGAALLSAIALSSILLLVAISISSVVITTVTWNRYNNKVIDDSVHFASNHALFVKNNGDISSLDKSLYDWAVYEGDPTSIKGLVAYIKNTDTIKFYSIYDFTEFKVLAYQERDFYITTEVIEEVEYFYLGGIIELPRGE